MISRGVVVNNRMEARARLFVRLSVSTTDSVVLSEATFEYCSHSITDLEATAISALRSLSSSLTIPNDQLIAQIVLRYLYR